ncbi:hypothetical protein PIB30_032851 [Stylosanthes scabra]|uniref:Cystatin domain-containing protein n=1 Tax=Stylosanthes scabra TaxID=79078 RepID=A0ABU6RCX5_9FABA|nr:hypothetical protein [Stylosanthes scabra]
MRTITIIVWSFLFCFAPLYYSAFAHDTAASRRGSSWPWASLMSPPIPSPVNVNKPWVINMAKFAVSEHNKISNANLELTQILSCTAMHYTLSDSYYLELLATDGVHTNKYFAHVYDGYFRSGILLRSFQLAPSLPQ